MESSTEGTIENIRKDLEEIMNQCDADRREAFELLLLSEVREMKQTLDTIETHTNNTVRKI